MIRYLQGIILYTEMRDKDSFVEILTSGGVGYQVFLSSNDYNKVAISNSEVELHTYHNIRDDNQTLFGFTSRDSRAFFEKLISVSGVGPKIALAMLSLYSANELKEYIENGDYKALSKTSGLGAKGAKKIIVELQGKIDLSAGNILSQGVLSELKDALNALGFDSGSIQISLEAGEIIFKGNKEIKVEELLQQVLRQVK